MKNIALLFPGQGSQYVGMGKELYNNYDAAKCVYDEASSHLNLDLKKLCFEAGMEELTKTENTQLAVFVTSIAYFRVFQKEVNISPKYFMGHSLGELSALTCTGAIQFCDALDIVKARGKFMQECADANDGSMAALKNADINQVKKICSLYLKEDKFVGISNYNSPNEIVISGHKKIIRDLIKELPKSNIRVIPLKVGAAFHSPLMKAAAGKFKEQLLTRNYIFYKMYCPVISNVTALPYEVNTNIISNLSQQIIKPVQWHKSMLFLAEEGIDTFIEIGPGEVLTKIVKNTFDGIQAYSFDKNNISVIQDFSSKSTDDKNNRRISFIEKSLAAAIALPNFGSDENIYEEKVIRPYQQMNYLLNTLVNNKEEPDDQQINQCITMLHNIFNFKKTTENEKNDRLNELWKILDEDKFREYLFIKSNI